MSFRRRKEKGQEKIKAYMPSERVEGSQQRSNVIRVTLRS